MLTFILEVTIWHAAFLLLNILTDLTSGSKSNTGINKLQARCMGAISTSWADVADAKAKKSREEGSNLKGPRFEKVKEDRSDPPNDLHIELLGSCLQKPRKVSTKYARQSKRTKGPSLIFVGNLASRRQRFHMRLPSYQVDPRVLQRRQEQFL